MVAVTHGYRLLNDLRVCDVETCSRAANLERFEHLEFKFCSETGVEGTTAATSRCDGLFRHRLDVVAAVESNLFTILCGV